MRKIILTVDDSSSWREMVGLALRKAGYLVLEAADGVDACAKLQLQPVNLVITELDLPRMNGIELIKRVRQMAALRSTPVLFFATESLTEKPHAARAAGATGWIVKPFTADQLIAVVSNVLHGSMSPAEAVGENGRC